MLRRRGDEMPFRLGKDRSAMEPARSRDRSPLAGAFHIAGQNLDLND
jgi:hypothetical protein